MITRNPLLCSVNKNNYCFSNTFLLMKRNYLLLQRDRIQRQIDYAKEVSERNRKTGQQTSGKSSRRTSYMDEEKETALNRRKQVLVSLMCLLLFPWLSRHVGYGWGSFFSTSPCPSPRPLLAQSLSILFSVVLNFLLFILNSFLSMCSSLLNTCPYQFQSSLRDIFGKLRQSRCSSDMFFPDLVFACHSTYPS